MNHMQMIKPTGNNTADSLLHKNGALMREAKQLQDTTKHAISATAGDDRLGKLLLFS